MADNDADKIMAEIENDLFGEETPASRTKRVFVTHGPLAAAQIVDIACNASNDNVRLKANQYIIDRVLGPAGREDQEDVLNDFLSGIQKLAGNSKSK